MLKFKVAGAVRKLKLKVARAVRSKAKGSKVGQCSACYVYYASHTDNVTRHITWHPAAACNCLDLEANFIGKAIKTSYVHGALRSNWI